MSEKIICDLCDGSGLISVEPIKCVQCTELKIYGCVGCKAGYKRLFIDTCHNCHGSGNIIKQK
jgi:DnaJ-class molecular chaperone